MSIGFGADQAEWQIIIICIRRSDGNAPEYVVQVLLIVILINTINTAAVSVWQTVIYVPGITVSISRIITEILDGDASWTGWHRNNNKHSVDFAGGAVQVLCAMYGSSIIVATSRTHAW